MGKFHRFMSLDDYLMVFVIVIWLLVIQTISAATVAFIFFACPKKTNQKKRHPGRLACGSLRSELFIRVVLTRILLGSHFRARPCALNPNKYLCTQQAQTGPVLERSDKIATWRRREAQSLPVKSEECLRGPKDTELPSLG